MTIKTHTANEAMMHAVSAHKRLDRVDTQLELLKNRLPVWATFFISALTFLLGSALTLLRVFWGT